MKISEYIDRIGDWCNDHPLLMVTVVVLIIVISKK